MRRMLLALLSIVINTIGLAQPSGGQPAFEAASVKRSALNGTGGPSCRGGPGTSDPGLLTCTNTALASLVIMAYGIQFYELVSPDWMIRGGSEGGYDIVARIPAGTTKADYRLMLQKLFSERFHLLVHHESKEGPRYVLQLAKGGSKLTPAAGPPPPGPRFAMAIVNGHLRFFAHSLSLESFAGFLTTQLSGSVTDETGLRGDYDIVINFMPDERWRGFASLPKADTPTTDVPNLFSAIQEQLGLKLDPRKGQIALLVVDRADKVPTEN